MWEQGFEAPRAIQRPTIDAERCGDFVDRLSESIWRIARDKRAEQVKQDGIESHDADRCYPAVK